MQFVFVFLFSIPVRNEKQSPTAASPTPQKHFKILPDGTVTESRDHQQQVRVAGQQVTSGASGGGSNVSVGGHAAETTSRKIRTVVCDDNEEELDKATTASTRRNYKAVFTSAPQKSTQVSLYQGKN